MCIIGSQEKTVLGRCPYCYGTGRVKLSSGYRHYSERDREKMVKLRQSGMTYREIGKKFGIKSPQSIKTAIETWVRRKRGKRYNDNT